MEEIISVIVNFAPLLLVVGMVWMVVRAWLNWVSARPYIVSNDDDASANTHQLSVTRDWWWPEDPTSPLHRQDD